MEELKTALQLPDDPVRVYIGEHNAEFRSRESGAVLGEITCGIPGPYRVHVLLVEIERLKQLQMTPCKCGEIARCITHLEYAVLLLNKLTLDSADIWKNVARLSSRPPIGG